MSKQSLIYEGNVTVKIVKGNTVYSQQTFHNNGRWPLFKHMTEALSGNYSNADPYRPLYLGIYSVPYKLTDEGDIPTIDDNSQSSSNHIKTYAKQEYLHVGSIGRFNRLPDVKTIPDDGIGNSTVTYHFVIPFSSLIITTLTERDDWFKVGYSISPLNLICLYSTANSWEGNGSLSPDKTYGNPSAYFFVEDLINRKKLGSLLPKSISSNKGKFSLVIDWQLKIQNLGTEAHYDQPFSVTWHYLHVKGNNTLEEIKYTLQVQRGNLPLAPTEGEPSGAPFSSKIKNPDANIYYAFNQWEDVSGNTIHIVDSDIDYYAYYWEIPNTITKIDDIVSKSVTTIVGN